MNLSSPNTPGLRDLQGAEASARLLETLKNEQQKLAAEHGKHVPLLFKVAPDLDEAHIRDLSQVFLDGGLDGLIATNTTLDREPVAGHPRARRGRRAFGQAGVCKKQRGAAGLRQPSRRAHPDHRRGRDLLGGGCPRENPGRRGAGADLHLVHLSGTAAGARAGARPVTRSNMPKNRAPCANFRPAAKLVMLDRWVYAVLTLHYHHGSGVPSGISKRFERAALPFSRITLDLGRPSVWRGIPQLGIGLALHRRCGDPHAQNPPGLRDRSPSR